MNAKTASRLMMLVILSIFSLYSLRETGLAQSPNSNCKAIKADSVETIGNAATFTDVGTFTNGGILNGTTEFVWNPATGVAPLTDPNSVSYFVAFTLTAAQGQLKARLVTMYNFTTGLFTSLAYINPDTSTGLFAGATGVVYFNGRTVGVFPNSSYPSQVTAQMCFAK